METFGIGILGCARIAKKNCRAVKKLSSSSCLQITAVASRSKEKAVDFVNEVVLRALDDGDGDDGAQQQTPRIFAGENAYDQLLNSVTRTTPLINAVYIPLPTMLHERYVAKALRSGKHVLLEKPVAPSSKSYREMLHAASQNGKFLMDGTMFVHHPRTKHFVTSIPNPNRVTFNFTFDGGSDFLKNDIRLKKDGDPMGCIGDLGWYCVRMGLLVFSSHDAGMLVRDDGDGGTFVTAVQVVRYEVNEEGVPYDADCLVHFSGNRVLSFHCSFIHPLNQTVHISGTGSKYTATMTDPVLPRDGDVLSYTLVKQGLIRYDEITTEEVNEIQIENSQVQEVCMWNNFARWARKVEQQTSSTSLWNGMNEQQWWMGDSAEVKDANANAFYSLYTAIVMDALMESIKFGGAKVQVKDM